MKVVILGAPLAYEEESWKDGLAHGATLLDWDVQHIHARNVLTENVVKACRDADMLIWARTHGYEPRGNALHMLRDVQDSGCRTVGVHLDLYWGLPGRERRIYALPWFKCEYIFTADGGNQEKWKQAGINHYWLPPAISERFFGGYKRMDWSPTKKLIRFVGSNIRSIHGMLWARRKYGYSFHHVGVGRHKVTGTKLSEIYWKSWAIIGDSAPSPYYWSDRVPRTMGRGAVLAYPETEGLKEWGFTEENMILFPRYGFDILGEKLDSLSSSERKNKVEAALSVIQERHLWTHRLRQIQRTVFNEK
jgi:hypothetical protein